MQQTRQWLARMFLSFLRVALVKNLKDEHLGILQKR